MNGPEAGPDVGVHPQLLVEEVPGRERVVTQRVQELRHEDRGRDDRGTHGQVELQPLEGPGHRDDAVPWGALCPGDLVHEERGHGHSHGFAEPARRGSEVGLEQLQLLLRRAAQDPCFPQGLGAEGAEPARDVHRDESGLGAWRREAAPALLHPILDRVQIDEDASDLPDPHRKPLERAELDIHSERSPGSPRPDEPDQRPAPSRVRAGTRG